MHNIIHNRSNRNQAILYVVIGLICLVLIEPFIMHSIDHNLDSLNLTHLTTMLLSIAIDVFFKLLILLNVWIQLYVMYEPKKQSSN